jgi:hypothetical protein
MKMKFYMSFWSNLFYVHIVTKVSLHFWNLRKIIDFKVPINPTLWKTNFDLYTVHYLKSHDLRGSGQ